ncbi:hypothetical protein EJ05DRAFT_497124 [Pseudovirgaria hyperparasitica]|uniref:Uncharacterized protein n=1 Tax=Pseudovirgaria hyperparasitica TaxID=470096 RepID=A0A6A6WHI2_9PEZI|nr:uncharacterized protein EJ05DRAFT_497124 [Pseudovirgaria hyperparasitica]KAF2762262.1 hypothetical protein EJ05DRAFT_497124 [Pseudovirgaria hyperparasitica]
MPRMPRKWTAEEDKALRNEVLAQLAEGEAKDWCRIASKLPGRTNKDCRKRWHNAVAGGLKKGQWAKSEDALLRRGVERHGQRWTLVAEEVRTRSADQCAKRWQQSLDPELDRSEWSEQENQQLLYAVSKIGRHWKEIQKLYFPGRSKNCIKNRYTVLTRKIQNQGGSVDAYANYYNNDDDDDDDDEQSEYQSETDHDFSCSYENDSGIDSARTGNSPTYSDSTRGSVSYSNSDFGTSWGAEDSVFPQVSSPSYNSSTYYGGYSMPTASYDTAAYADLPTPTPQTWWNQSQVNADSSVDPALLHKGSADGYVGTYFSNTLTTSPTFASTSPAMGSYSVSAGYGYPTGSMDADMSMTATTEDTNLYAAQYNIPGQQSVRVSMTLKQPCTATMTNLMRIAVDNGARFFVEQDRP